MTPFRIAAAELRRITAGKLPKLAVLALVLVPLMYGSLYLYANWDPYGNLNEVPAAIVVEDRGATKDGKTTHAGEDVANELVDGHKFDWHRTDRADAEDGVRNGRYTFSLTFPADFSEALTSSGDFQPKQGTIVVTTNDANNYLVGTIANKVTDEIRRAVTAKVGKEAADKFLLGFSTIAQKMREAADGSAKLADGNAQVDANLRRLNEEGQRKLLNGVEEMYGKTKDMPAQSKQLDDGMKQLAGGLGQMRDKTRDMPAKTKQLADGAKQVADGSGQLAGGAVQLADGARRVADGNAELASKASEAGRIAQQVTDDVSNGEINKLARQACAEHPGLPGCDLVDKANTRLRELNGQIQQKVSDVNRLSEGARQVADGNTKLAQSATKLADGARQVADGTGVLASSSTELVNGIAQLNDGAGKLSDGTGKLAAAAPQLVDGVTKLRDGEREVVNKTQQLIDEGTAKTKDGAKELASKIGEGAGKVPNPDDPTRKATAETISDPVAINKLSEADAGKYGAGLAPFFLGLSLWIGAFVLFLLLKPLNARALAAGQPSLRVAVGGWLPAALLGAAQVTLLYTVVTTLIGVDPAHPVATFGFLLLTSLAFTALLHGLNSFLGSVGKFVALVLLVLQLTTAGGTFPWQTTPAPLHPLHMVLPLSYVVDGLRHLIYGGSLSGMGVDVAVIVGWLVAGLALSTLAARQQKVWTPKKLKPELVL
ncbi:putative membrane protein [Streptoalloteichus tenebrarius]|uniref:Membrane protein n=1 Tax=Streptoalloteichus tenebrarius (strain ATCC 17920 / DSM 40477 / JCM 4838 / CBS 697.72 / NBRC 16177 / NCIMB 11028 / NRRL B-12390 / A12253. 1 / ISP 5477) TaxID=1933 RepID=A0ABT1I035_STRSD|nr:YhgE/Pip domain-containing protein [Streptoalloteichus tenebrarius]MCP2261130.1 putative membrane protein [Streptoalloteichus tenebrarius]BFF03961.1 YhgE/Pip domain-containing protein [Streptoalloteichus tenebrarius]